MQRKGWLVPILVFLVSIVCLLFYQRSNVQDSFATTTNLPPILWSKSPADFTKLTYSEFGLNFEATKTEDIWKLTAPVNTPADALYIYNILSYFSTPAFIEVIDIFGNNLLDYGIDESSPTLTLYEGEKTYSLVRGYAIDANHYYVYSPASNAIYSMEKSGFDSIQTDLNVWRDKQLLSFKKDEIKDIVLNLEGELFTIIPDVQGSVLKFTSPDVSSNVATTLVDFLQSAQISNFITDNMTPTLGEIYGITQSTHSITIHLKDGKSFLLTLGNVNEAENLCYVQVNNTPSIVSIPYLNLSGFIKETPKESTEEPATK